MDWKSGSLLVGPSLPLAEGTGVMLFLAIGAAAGEILFAGLAGDSSLRAWVIFDCTANDVRRGGGTGVFFLAGRTIDGVSKFDVLCTYQDKLTRCAFRRLGS